VRAGVGWSCLDVPREAGREATHRALRGLGRPAILFVFTTSTYQQEEILAGVLQEAGEVPLIGACGAGVITPAGIWKEGVAVLALAGEEIRGVTAVAEFAGSEPWETGRQLGKELLAGSGAAAGTVFVFPDGLADGITEMLCGLYDVLGPAFTYTGGGTGDNLRFMQTYQITEKRVASGAVAAALITGLSCHSLADHGWKPVGPPLVITKARSKVVYELDARPAFLVYAERLGGIEPEKLPEKGLEYPLGMPNAAGRFIIRDPLRFLPGGAIELATEAPSKAVAYLMHAQPLTILETARKVTAQALSSVSSPVFALLFNCVSRTLLVNNEELEHNTYREILGTVPYAGFLTSGEVAAYHSAPLFHNKTLVVTVGGR